jgi:glycosyltransferase involved in cell wall biosynthesis
LKVLYVTYRYDVNDITLGSGQDYFLHRLFKDLNYSVKVIGPFDKVKPSLCERVIRKVCASFLTKRWIKYDFSVLNKISKIVNLELANFKPDILFSIYPVAFYKIRCNNNVKTIYWVDTMLYGEQNEFENFNWFASKLFYIQEKRALSNITNIWTISDWSSQILKINYKYRGRIDWLPLPSAIPHEIILQLKVKPKIIDKRGLVLLFIGKDKHRKGYSVMLEIYQILIEKNINFKMIICGIDGENVEHLTHLPLFNKNNSIELKKYIDLFLNAHLLIHPALFEAGGTVITEASAFGVPVITNNTGGLSSTTINKETGIVLRKGAKAIEYVDEIEAINNNSDLYRLYSKNCIKRYMEIGHWSVWDKLIENL